MTRREILGGLAAASLLRAQTAEGIRYREYARCLPDYLADLAAEAYARRNARIKSLETSPAIREYQSWARQTFRQLVGVLPERTPLNLRTVGGFDREHYRVEKLVYESRPGFVVAANLYLPKDGTGPFPGVLFQMGHSNNGKSYALYQRCCQGLVQLGYVVLAFDPIGQGERTYYPQPGGWLTRLRSATDEHTVPGRPMLLAGETATGAMLWDAIRSLDVLAGLPQVDAKRLASTGQSGGATLTMILAAMDDRLAAAAVSSGNTENFAVAPFLAPGSSDDAEQDLIGSAPLAFDRWDMLWPIAPKPLLIAVSAHDWFGTYSPAYERSGREEYARLSQAYKLLGAEGRLRFFESPLPHSLSQPLRMAIYRWFERHLKNSDRPILAEPPTRPETDEALWCGSTGNTVRDFRSRTPFDLLRERAQAIATPRQPGDLRKLLQIDPPQNSRLEVRAAVEYTNCRIQAVEVYTAKHVWAPAWFFLPKRDWSRLVILVEPNGRNGAWHEDELYDRLASSGVAACALDVRGVGDLQPQFGGGAAGYARSHQDEENYAWASLILGHGLLGQRVSDILGMTRALASAYPHAEIKLAARERMTVPALCAAALEPRIAKVYLARHLVSWRSIVENQDYTCPLASMAPGCLAVADLPHIARAIAPRQVIVAGAIDAAGRAVPRDQVPYSEYRDSASWDVQALAE